MTNELSVTKTYLEKARKELKDIKDARKSTNAITTDAMASETGPERATITQDRINVYFGIMGNPQVNVERAATQVSTEITKTD